MKDKVKIEKSKVSILDSIKKSFHTKKFRGGAYTTLTSIIVIAIILIINIIITELNIKVDVSSQNLYTLTDETIDLAKGIKDDITIYYFAQTGGEDSRYAGIVEKYDSLSSKIKVEYKDPILYPKFASKYVSDTINSDSILVVNNSNDRAKYIDYSELSVYEYDYSTYTSYETGIDVEGQVTSALSYVTKDVLPIVYQVEGHGEVSISDTLITALTKANVTTNTLKTISTKSIPEDCSVLLINAPQNDYTEDEINMIKDYLVAGGKAIILVDYEVEGLINFNSLLNYYGVSLANGIVLETNSNYYMGQYVNNLLPDINSHTITLPIKSDKKYVVVPLAKGIVELDTKRSTVEITPLLTTSEDAFSKVDMEDTTITKQSSDIDGPFYLGVAIDETYNGNETNLVVYSSSFIMDESIIAARSSYGNLDLILNTVNYLAGEEESVSIPAKSTTQEYVTLTAAQVNFWASIVVIIIPVVILSIGGYVCIKRRKK